MPITRSQTEKMDQANVDFFKQAFQQLMENAKDMSNKMEENGKDISNISNKMEENAKEISYMSNKLEENAKDMTNKIISMENKVEDSLKMITDNYSKLENRIENMEDMISTFKYKGDDMMEIRRLIASIMKKSNNESKDLISLLLCGLIRGNNIKKMHDKSRSTPDFIAAMQPIFDKYNIQSNISKAVLVGGAPVLTLSRTVAAFAEYSLEITLKTKIPSPVSNEKFGSVGGFQGMVTIPDWLRGQYVASLIPKGDSQDGLKWEIYCACVIYSASLTCLIRKISTASEIEQVFQDSCIYTTNAYESDAISEERRIECFSNIIKNTPVTFLEQINLCKVSSYIDGPDSLFPTPSTTPVGSVVE